MARNKRNTLCLWHLLLILRAKFSIQSILIHYLCSIVGWLWCNGYNNRWMGKIKYDRNRNGCLSTVYCPRRSRIVYYVSDLVKCDVVFFFLYNSLSRLSCCCSELVFTTPNKLCSCAICYLHKTILSEYMNTFEWPSNEKQAYCLHNAECNAKLRLHL